MRWRRALRMRVVPQREPNCERNTRWNALATGVSADAGRERDEVPAGDRPGADVVDERAGGRLDRADQSEPGRARADARLQNSADPSQSSSETTAALLTRYRLDQVSCSTHTSDPSYHPSDGVTCAQIQNLSDVRAERRHGRDRPDAGAEPADQRAARPHDARSRARRAASCRISRASRTRRAQLTSAQNAVPVDARRATR